MMRARGCDGKFESTHGMYGSAEYSAFHRAKNRCENKDNSSYFYYGGKGVKFLFDSFEQFYADVGPKVDPNTSLDRLDSNGNYETGNVRWATLSEQAANRSNTICLEIGGVSKPLSHWTCGERRHSKRVWYRLSKGYCHSCAVYNDSRKPCSHQ